jgi:hypothetical protein
VPGGGYDKPPPRSRRFSGRRAGGQCPGDEGRTLRQVEVPDEVIVHARTGRNKCKPEVVLFGRIYPRRLDPGRLNERRSARRGSRTATLARAARARSRRTRGVESMSRMSRLPEPKERGLRRCLR